MSRRYKCSFDCFPRSIYRCTAAAEAAVGASALSRTSSIVFYKLDPASCKHRKTDRHIAHVITQMIQYPEQRRDNISNNA